MSQQVLSCFRYLKIHHQKRTDQSRWNGKRLNRKSC